MDEAAAELTKAREKLHAAEAALDAVKGGDDAQQIAEAKLGVTEAKLGVAKAELGVAKAELGVAKAEWEAAAEGERKVRLGGLVETARGSVESAQKIVGAATTAYQNALSAAAPPHGRRTDRLGRFVSCLYCVASIYAFFTHFQKSSFLHDAFLLIFIGYPCRSEWPVQFIVQWVRDIFGFMRTRRGGFAATEESAPLVEQQQRT